MSLHADLSSTATSLAELSDSLGHAASQLTGTDHDDVGSDLIEVQRLLDTAGRRLARAVAELARRPA